MKNSKKSEKKLKENTEGINSGPAWYGIQVSWEQRKDPILQRQLRLLQMRNALNPKQHYKKADKELPKVFQVEYLCIL